MDEPNLDELVCLSHNEYADLLTARERLYALEGAGVDNWDGYSEADFEAADARVREEMKKVEMAEDKL